MQALTVESSGYLDKIKTWWIKGEPNAYIIVKTGSGAPLIRRLSSEYGKTTIRTNSKPFIIEIAYLDHQTFQVFE